MADSVILNKVASIERCVQRVKEDYNGHEKDIAIHNYTKLDLAVVRAIIEGHLPTFLNFTREVLAII